MKASNLESQGHPLFFYEEQSTLFRYRTKQYYKQKKKAYPLAKTGNFLKKRKLFVFNFRKTTKKTNTLSEKESETPKID